jgi:hypothetical protein
VITEAESNKHNHIYEKVGDHVNLALFIIYIAVVLVAIMAGCGMVPMQEVRWLLLLLLLQLPLLAFDLSNSP